MAETQLSGPIYSETQVTASMGLFIPAPVGGSFYTGTWTDTRLAAGDYVMRKTAAANAGQAVFHLASYINQMIGSDPMVQGRTHDIRGYEITSIDVIYAIATTALNSHTYDITQVTYANNTANAVVTTPGGTLTGTLATATQANPYVTNLSLGTPYVIATNTALRSCDLEIAWDAAVGTVLDYYGVYVRLDYNVL